MSWRTFLKDYFRFSRAERFGTGLLCGCVLLLFIVKWSLPGWISPRIPDTSKFSDEIVQFRSAVDAVSQEKDIFVNAADLQPTFELFFFDPNKTSDEEWKQLGMNERQIRNIRNYQEKGGQFKQKEDLRKLYTISTTQYQQLAPYIRITANIAPVTEKRTAPVTKEEATTSYTPRSATKIQIELNTADSAMLTQLSGIGPVLASRTIKYRDRIGGFANVSQLAEVYGINGDLVERLQQQLSTDSSFIRKIQVNTATYRELIAHPYLNDQLVRGILNYLKLQKRINSIDELVQNHILNHDEAERISPYLDFSLEN